AFRNAEWHLLDLDAKYQAWARAVGNDAVAERIFQAALDLSDARQGALFAVLRKPEEAADQLVLSSDRLIDTASAAVVDPGSPQTRRRELLSLLTARDVRVLDLNVLEALASIDGATVLDCDGRVWAIGAVLRHPPGVASGDERVEGART